jgi:hypothetical protein
MALEIALAETIAIIQQHLPSRARYRCIVIQGKDIAVLSQLSEQIAEAARVLDHEIEEIDALNTFDTIGALSCDALIERIKTVSCKKQLLISGPLHFLDYWSPTVRSVFWNFLAAFANGPGIIVTDVFRNEVTLGPWQNVKGFARSDLRCFKSRLESTQDCLA